MSTIDTSRAAKGQDKDLRDPNRLVVDRLLNGENAIDRWMIRHGDRLSPIVVKETRQALKSKQFVWTFLFLLLGILGWTILAVVSLLPGLYYYPGGMTLLGGYIVMLLIPALLIVPLTAFFSMAGELNSNTFEVLSVSPLSSHKIVIGKIIVAGVQLLLFFSALAPCIALTYLLRGVAIMNLLFLFPVLAIISFVTIAISVMLGTLGRNIVHMVFFLLVQLCVSILIFYNTIGIVFESRLLESISDSPFELSMAILWLGAVASYGVLAIFIGGASIGIAGENYAKPIRMWLAFQSYLIFAGGAATYYFSTYTYKDQILYSTMGFLGLHWFFTGIFLVSHKGVLTPRMQRSLPSRLSSKLLLGWLAPGGGTGYMFTVLCFTSLVIASMVLRGLTSTIREAEQIFPVVALAYIVLYLGALRILMLFVPATTGSRPTLAALLMLLLIAMGVGVPTFISSASRNFVTADYEFYSFTDPFSTIARLDYPASLATPLTLLFLTSFGIFCINAFVISSDLSVVSVKMPDTKLATQTKTEPTPDPFA